MRLPGHVARCKPLPIALLACCVLLAVLFLGPFGRQSQFGKKLSPLDEEDDPTPVTVEEGAGIWRPNYETVVALHGPEEVYTHDNRYLPLHLTEKWQRRRNLTFWSSDFHIAPVEDIRHLFKEMGVNLIIKSLSGHCHLTGTCATDLKVLHHDLYNTPDKDLCKIRKKFFEAYKDDPEMKSVDAFICFHATFVCEFFAPFNKSIIVLPSTRYEGGREGLYRWTVLNSFLTRFAEDRRNVLGANNLYDAAYLHYFTGIRTAFVSSYCGYTNVVYKPTRPEILLVTKYGPTEAAIKNAAAKMKSPLTFAHYRNLYPQYKYEDLVQHPAIVNMPYQLSVMSYFEHYRMCIPMFFPSPTFLSELHFLSRGGVMPERTWPVVRGWGQQKQSVMPRAPNVSIPYDPNDELDPAALEYWVGYADFYLWPHITYYDSWKDLIRKLHAADFAQISKDMCAHNEKSRNQIKAQWSAIFARIEQGAPLQPNPIPLEFDTTWGNCTYANFDDDDVGSSSRASSLFATDGHAQRNSVLAALAWGLLLLFLRFVA